MFHITLSSKHVFWRTAEDLEKAEFGPLVPPQRYQYMPVHRWHTFQHGYSKDLAVSLISEFNLLFQANISNMKLDSFSWRRSIARGGSVRKVFQYEDGIERF